MSRFHGALPALLLFLGSPAYLASRAHADGSEAQVQLSRPTPAVDPDAAGRLEMERESRHEQEFEVEIQHIDTASGVYTLWIESQAGSGTFENAGEFAPEGLDEAKYERELGGKKKEGVDELPLGVHDLRELENRAVEVRDASAATILIGTIPPLSSGHGGGGHGGNGEGDERELPLLRPASEPIPGATGKVSAEIEGQDSELEIETEGFDVTTTIYSVWIEDGVGVLQNVGDLESESEHEEGQGEEDEGQISWNTEEGDSLPFGATSVRDLGGRRVEIRDPQDVVVLEGSIPTFGSAGSQLRRSKSRLSATTAGQPVDAAGRISAQFQPRQGRFQLRIDASARTNDDEATLWITAPATGQMERVATGTWTGKKHKKIRWQWRSDRSQPLPVGVTDPSQLFGQEVEVRDASGTVILTGRL